MSKICQKCGKTVEDRAKFCPYCKGQEFRNKNEIAVADNNLMHKIFYNNYDGYYIMSKTKFASLSVFLTFSVAALLSGAPGAIILIALLFAGITYILGYAFRQIIGKPSQVKIVNNDYGLIDDLKYFLFFWQNNHGEFVLSKTKVISHITFLLFFLLGLLPSSSSLIVAIFIGLIFEIPVFLIGFAVHKLTNPDPQIKSTEAKPIEKSDNIKSVPAPQKTIPQKKVISEYVEYQKELDDLNSKFILKDKSVRKLIEKRFEPPQLTYTRFISIVDKSGELFKKHMQSAFTLINLADEYSPRIAGEIESKINVLKSILNKLEDLSNELVLNDNLTDSGEVDGLIDDMDNLIKSVKSYE